MHYNEKQVLRAVRSLAGPLPPVSDTDIGSSSPLHVSRLLPKGNHNFVPVLRVNPVDKVVFVLSVILIVV